jgi:hypothetical protein
VRLRALPFFLGRTFAANATATDGDTIKLDGYNSNTARTTKHSNFTI